MKNRTYTELSKLSTFEERFRYLQLRGVIGEDTFGFERYLNQKFYKSKEWKKIRDQVILRDDGNDLGIPDRPIAGKAVIHHMNVIRISDILEQTDLLLNPDYLICCSLQTHNAIHYGDDNLLSPIPVERFKNDTCPWKNR